MNMFRNSFVGELIQSDLYSSSSMQKSTAEGNFVIIFLNDAGDRMVYFWLYFLCFDLTTQVQSYDLLE